MRAWAIPALIIVLIEYACALVMGASVGFAYSIPFGQFALLGFGIGFPCVVVTMLALLARYALEGEARPSRRLLALAPRLGGFFVGAMLVTAQMAVLMWLKIMLPLVVPFWADGLLADVDHLLFRTEPWLLSHALFGWASPVIDRAYVTWMPIKLVALAFVFAAPEDSRKVRAVLAYFVTVSVVALGEYLLSSAGPVFFHAFGFGDRFAPMPIEPWVERARDYLWSDYLKSGGNIGGGISAMPSLHVAIALWIALVIKTYMPKASPIGWAYFVLIFVGSVHLGWHYAMDSIVAVAIALLAWRADAWLVRRRDKPIAAPLVASPATPPGASMQS